MEKWWNIQWNDVDCYWGIEKQHLIISEESFSVSLLKDVRPPSMKAPSNSALLCPHSNEGIYLPNSCCQTQTDTTAPTTTTSNWSLGTASKVEAVKESLFHRGQTWKDQLWKKPKQGRNATHEIEYIYFHLPNGKLSYICKPQICFRWICW